MKLPVCMLLLIPVCLARDGIVSWSGLQLKPGQKVIALRNDGSRWRVAGTVLGSAAGLFGGGIAAGRSSGISGSTGAATTLFAPWTGGTVTGFFLGRQADQRSDSWSIQKP